MPLSDGVPVALSVATTLTDAEALAVSVMEGSRLNVTVSDGVGGGVIVGVSDSDVVDDIVTAPVNEREVDGLRTGVTVLENDVESDNDPVSESLIDSDGVKLIESLGMTVSEAERLRLSEPVSESDGWLDKDAEDSGVSEMDGDSEVLCVGLGVGLSLSDTSTDGDAVEDSESEFEGVGMIVSDKDISCEGLGDAESDRDNDWSFVSEALSDKERDRCSDELGVPTSESEAL